MNELSKDLDPWYVPTKFGRDQRTIAPGGVETGLAGEHN